jgi:hypothetical protein
VGYCILQITGERPGDPRSHAGKKMGQTRAKKSIVGEVACARRGDRVGYVEKMTVEVGETIENDQYAAEGVDTERQ